MDILQANDYMMAQTHIRLFHRLFYKISLFYATNISKRTRRIIDGVLLFQTTCCLVLLLYVHWAFLNSPGTCLDDHFDTWPKDGILQVQINTSDSQFLSFGFDDEAEVYNAEEQYIMEYSLHYSFLRMDSDLRNNLSIKIENVTLSRNDKCFGNFFSRFLLENLFGYDDMLMSSFKKLATNISNKGYLKNCITGEHYRFIDTWCNKLNYVLSFFIMIALTAVVAMLMRLCHHQLFKFFCKLLFALQNHVLYPVWMPFPIASLLTMFLGLWGLETIMTDLLDDPMVSFHLIAYVWMADNYYTICCHNQLSKKHFPRFFYLCNYLFYAFHLQHKQFSGLALVTTFMSTQLVMVYFYHRYELPIVELFISRTQQQNRGGGNSNNNPNNSNPLNIEAMVTNLIQLQQTSYASLDPYSQSPYNGSPNVPQQDHINLVDPGVAMIHRWRIFFRYLERIGLLRRGREASQQDVNDTQADVTAAHNSLIDALDGAQDDEIAQDVPENTDSSVFSNMTDAENAVSENVTTDLTEYTLDDSSDIAEPALRYRGGPLLEDTINER